MKFKFKSLLKAAVIVLLVLAVALPASAQFELDLEYRETDIKDVLRSLAMIAGENIIVDDSAVGEVTVQLEGVTYDEAFQHLLNIKDLEAYHDDRITIVASPDRIDELYREVDRRLIRLDHIEPEAAQEVLVEMVPELDVQISPTQNRLILRGFTHHLDEAAEIMADIDEPVDREHRVIEIFEQNPQDVAEELSELFPDLTVRARPQAGDIILQGKRADLDEAENMIAELDVPDREVEEIYRATDVEAEELLREIEGLYPEERLELRREDNIITLQGKPDIVEEALELLAELDEVEEVVERRTHRADYIDLEELEEIVTDMYPELEVSRSEGERTIVMQGDERDLEQAYSMVQEMDQARRQVMIEVLIEEISHTEMKDRGVDPGIFTDITTIGVDYDAGEIDVTAPDLFRLMDEEGLSETMARPRLMTLDGEEAELVIGDRVPYEVREVVDGEIQTVDYEYADVGITLDFVPTITRDDTITLDIRPEVSTITDMGPDLAPPQVRTREMDSILSLEDGETFAVGGLIQDEIEETIREFPLLADLPILGELFRYRQEEEEKTEIVIFITPHLIDIGEDVSAEEMEELDTEERVEEFEEDIPETEEMDEEDVEVDVEDEEETEERSSLQEIMEDRRDEEEVDEEAEVVETREMTAQELNQILFRSRLGRRPDWPEEYEFSFTADERISDEELKNMYDVSSDDISVSEVDGIYEYDLILPSDMVYELEEEETLSEIADLSGLTEDVILEASRLSADEVEAGTTLIMPFEH